MKHDVDLKSLRFYRGIRMDSYAIRSIDTYDIFPFHIILDGDVFLTVSSTATHFRVLVVNESQVCYQADKCVIVSMYVSLFGPKWT